jgi:hypothetical protein
MDQLTEILQVPPSPGGGTFSCRGAYRFYFDPGQDGYGRVTVNSGSKVDFIQ